MRLRGKTLSGGGVLVHVQGGLRAAARRILGGKIPFLGDVAAVSAVARGDVTTDPGHKTSPERKRQIERHKRRVSKRKRELKREERDRKSDSPPDDDEEPLEALVAAFRGSTAAALEALGDEDEDEELADDEDDEDAEGEEDEVTDHDMLEAAMAGLDEKGRAQFLALHHENTRAKLRQMENAPPRARRRTCLSPEDATTQGSMLRAMTFGLPERDADEVRAAFGRALKRR
ncbi:MAG: hypothetical protein ACM3O6_11370 [Acidobacteriota bacterium]